MITKPEGVATVWPPSGLLLAALVCSPRGSWPSITLLVLLAITIANLFSGNSLLISLAFAVANLTESLLAAILLCWGREPPLRLRTLRDILRFVLVAAVAANALTALLGAAVSSLAFGAAFWSVWRIWWVADGLGIVVIGCLIIMWYDDGWNLPQGWWRLAEFGALVLVLVLGSLVLFGRAIGITAPYLIFPPLIWVALRFGMRGASAAVAWISVVAVESTLSRVGPFAQLPFPLTEQVLRTQLFLLVMSLSTFTLATIMRERQDAQAQLQHANRLLEQRVAERTAALRAANALLQQNEARLQQLYAQEQAARSQAEEASQLKDEFLATVSHELRTPLTTFLGYAQLLQSRRRDEAYIARAVDKMVKHAQIQAQLIEDLLDMSRIVSGKLRIEPQPIDLLPVIHAAVDTVRPAVEAKALVLHTDLNSSAGPVLGDPGRLQQVIWNLLSNAVKFTPPGGRVMLRLTRCDTQVELEVSDTGQGIPPDFLPFVFDRFRQAEGTLNRAHGGLGLGLSIVRHVVELHGGTVQAASAGVGQGACFTVRLPLSSQAQPGPSAPTETPDASPAPLAGVRVLLVDDQPDLLEMLHELLTIDGAMVQCCTTAREALGRVAVWRPAVLVSDIGMPGEDGYWLIDSVRALAPEQGGSTPALALTAYARLEDRLRVLGAGFQGYLAKPVDAEVLRDEIARLALHGAVEH